MMLRAILYFVLGLMVAGGTAISGVLDHAGDYFHHWWHRGAMVSSAQASGGYAPLVMHLSADGGGCPVAYAVRNDSGRTLDLGIAGITAGPIAVPPGKALMPESNRGCALVRIELKSR